MKPIPAQVIIVIVSRCVSIVIYSYETAHGTRLHLAAFSLPFGHEPVAVSVGIFIRMLEIVHRALRHGGGEKKKSPN